MILYLHNCMLQTIYTFFGILSIEKMKKIRISK